jgi:uncharacterized cupin superfamily protein
MLRVNVHGVELDTPLDLAGFRHDGTSLMERFGATQIGAGLYEAFPGQPIWPFHYHHGVEEWLMVLSGAPRLREAAGTRVLSPGDLLAFPSGPEGAHTVSGPGRFIIFSGPHGRRTGGTVYPDSDKVSGPEGILLRGPRVDYWYREGTGEVDAELGAPEPLVLDGAPRPVANLDAVVPDLPVSQAGPDADLGTRSVALGPLIGATEMGATLYEVGPGEGTAPYHYEYGCEEAVLVLSGEPVLRHPEGEDRLAEGDLVSFSEGPKGAHRLVNRGTEVVRLLILSTKGWPCSVCYPDSGTWQLFNRPDAEAVRFRASDPARYGAAG